MMINILHCPLLSIWASGNYLFFSRSPIVTRALFRSAQTADTLLRCNSMDMGNGYTVDLQDREGHREPLRRDGLVHSYTISLPRGHQVLINLCGEDDAVYASSVANLLLNGSGALGDILSIPRRSCTNEGWQ